MTFPMEASDHSYGSAVCPVNYLRCDLFAPVIRPTASPSSQVEKPFYLSDINSPQDELVCFELEH